MAKINKEEFRDYVYSKTLMREDMKIEYYLEDPTRIGFLTLQKKLREDLVILDYFDAVSGLSIKLDTNDLNSDPNSAIAFIKIKDWIETNCKHTTIDKVPGFGFDEVNKIMGL